ncbi:hypothetical protein [Mycoplasmopsis iners]|uniref:hypothetical protein n=1 Tax=Mycoplasmopsis iners TaxID=76630 RepID=UPI00068D4E37|nr:hypothetical protein [Mycoplasmopsis iners]
MINTKIIYARQGADDFTLSFPEDSYTFSSSDNLVGELDWKYLKEVLEDNNFVNYSQQLFAQIDYKTIEKGNYGQLINLKNQILNLIGNELNNPTSFLNTYSNSLITVFDSSAIESKKIKTIIEKKVYLATALIYSIYFNSFGSNLLDAILLNEKDITSSVKTNTFNPQQFNIQINENNYLIGGYSSYTPIQEVREIDGNNKIIIRYNLHESDNYLFQNIDQVYELQRSSQIISKIGYVAIWISLISALMLLNAYKYMKKDYK